MPDASTRLDLDGIKDRNRHWAATGEGGDYRTWKDVDALVNEVERLRDGIRQQLEDWEQSGDEWIEYRLVAGLRALLDDRTETT